MKTFNLIIFFSLLLPIMGMAAKNDMNQFVLEAISEMPAEGGYELTVVPAQRMAEAFSLRTSDDLTLNPFLAVPSYCTTATYMVFFKVLERYWAENSTRPGPDVLVKLKPQLENDGVRIWGRWNSNGPGTAKLFRDTNMGTNFDDITKARAGDFIKIFWNDKVGKFEKGHTGVFLGLKVQNGKQMLHFWASSKSTNGFAERIIPLTEANRILFSRLDRPENYRNIANLPELDSFLASMLTREIHWSELKEASGF